MTAFVGGHKHARGRPRSRPSGRMSGLDLTLLRNERPGAAERERLRAVVETELLRRYAAESAVRKKAAEQARAAARAARRAAAKEREETRRRRAEQEALAAKPFNRVRLLKDGKKST